MSQQQTFNDAYWAHQPPELQVLRGIQDTPEGWQKRSDLAHALALQGFLILPDVMVQGYDPWFVMNIRKEDGYTWLPNLLQPRITVAPGIAQAGVPMYDPSHPPAGSIKVSTDLTDYPPFTPPAAAPAHTHTGSWVGDKMTGANNLYYAPFADDPNADGTEVSDPRGTFIKKMKALPWGVAKWYEPKS